MNRYQRMQRFMTNFEYDKHFFPSHHCITSEQQKMIPHISKYLEIYTLYLSRQATKISVLCVKDFKQYFIQ